MKQISTQLTPIYQNPKPIHPGTEIGHVHLKTADIQRIADFYVGVLGFDVIAQMPSALFLSTGGYHHDLAFNTWESKGGIAPPPECTGLYHVAIRFPTRRALADALQRLLEVDWPLQGASDHGTHEAIYLADPDGNGLELCWDRPDEQWPVEPNGMLGFVSKQVDIKGLLAELAIEEK